MSLVPSNKTPRQKKTQDLSLYHKEYREKNLEHLRNLERLSYYKRKHNLDNEFIALFGEYSSDVFKILKSFNELNAKCPELAPHIISRMNAESKLN